MKRDFLIIFLRARVFPLLCLYRPFCISEICLDLNPDNCCSKQARYQLSNPSPYNLATHLPKIAWSRGRFKMILHCQKHCQVPCNVHFFIQRQVSQMQATIFQHCQYTGEKKGNIFCTVCYVYFHLCYLGKKCLTVATISSNIFVHC